MFSDSLLHLNVTRDGQLSRRRLLRLGAGAFCASPFLWNLRSRAEELKKEGRSCILVWLAGAPSQLDTWDPKPGTPNGGQTKAIKTSVPGVQVAEYFPRMAQMMKEVAIIRSIQGKEAAHERGTYHLHTGRRLTGAEKHPNFGSVVAYQLGDEESDIPNFVSVGKTVSSGFLGVQVAPFIVDKPGTLPANVASRIPDYRAKRRMALLAAQEKDFASSGAQNLVKEHQALYSRANMLMKSPRLKAFELADEPKASKDAYGNSQFGQGLLVARRLVETGVPFVEVRKGGWDMHNSLYEKIKPAAGDVDRGLSQLLKDLKQRGMLEKTLVICMGEFGRTPKINKREPAPGRDHWAKNFCAVLAGAGIQGGQVVGSTSRDGQEISNRPVEVEDLFQTFCKAMQIDADEELYTPGGRPLAIVDGGVPVKELFS